MDRRRGARVAGSAAVAALVAAAMIALLGAGAPRPTAVSYPFRSMGTIARVVLVTPDSAAGEPTAQVVRATFARVDSLMSNWTTKSEVARINRTMGRDTIVVEPEVARVIETSLLVGRETSGAFDITVEPLVRLWGFLGGPKRVPAEAEIAAAFSHVGARRLQFDAMRRTLHASDPAVRIDLGGIAKGYAVMAAGESLRARGIQNAIVDASGNMDLIGHPPDAPYWRVGIRDPRDRTPYFARLHLTGVGISTSAKYEQFVAQDGRTYGHIMDPRTGRPAEGLISVTVVAGDAMMSDAWDTPLFVLGLAEAKRLAQSRPDFAAVLVSPGRANVDTVWVENALKDRFALEPGEDARFHVEYF